MTKSTYSGDFSDCTGAHLIADIYFWNPPGIYGGNYSLKLCYSNITFTFSGGNPTLAERTSVLLPNNASWTFAYTASDNSYIPILDLNQITFPTGGPSLPYPGSSLLDEPQMSSEMVREY
jgi:hypothetical protein